MQPNQKNADGKRSELLASDWLFAQGCHVYMHVLEQGPIDIIALSPKGEILLFDVKTVSRREDGTIISRTLKQKQQDLGVRLLYVDLVTHECHLYPHQFNPSRLSVQNASNRQHGGGKVPTIGGLLHPESSLINQSSSEAS
jgi:hypothetical protein